MRCSTRNGYVHQRWEPTVQYFFNLAGAMHDPDAEGLDLPSLSDAREMAVRDLAGYLRDKPEIVWGGEELRMEVSNEAGLLLCTVIVLGIDAPAAGGASPAC